MQKNSSLMHRLNNPFAMVVASAAKCLQLQHLIQCASFEGNYEPF